MSGRAFVLVAIAWASAGLIASPRAQSGTGTIEGSVVSTGSQTQPIGRAIVSISGGSIAGNLSSLTDQGGRFRFLDLTPGRYTISVTKPAYLPMTYGATRPGRPGTTIALATGQKLDLRIALPKGAVITGTVRDQFGQPVSGTQITISRAETVGAAGGFSTGAMTLLTDDRGVYRAFGLMPDEYVVAALPRLSGNAEMSALTRAEVDARLRALEQGRGATAPVVPATAASATRADASRLPDRVGYAPTFYPGTTIAANAARVRVAAGDERAGIDIPLIPVKAAQVSGTIQSGDIAAWRLRPSLSMMGPPQPVIYGPSLIGPAADGSFTFTNVTPGRYTLLVRSGPGALMAYSDGRNGATSDNPNVAAMFAAVDFDVDGSDITGITLVLKPALSISGKVRFEGSQKPPENLTTIRVTLGPAGPMASGPVASGLLPGASAPSPVAVLADGTFEIAGVVPGVYSLSASAGSQWRLRSAVVNGRDVLDDPLLIDGSSVNLTGALLTFSDLRSELAGTLTAASGQPATEFTVLVFSANRDHWRLGSRRIKTVRPASDGAFSIMDLPAGDYLLAALTDVDPADLADSSFLEQVVASGIRVKIANGQATRQDLRIAR